MAALYVIDIYQKISKLGYLNREGNRKKCIAKYGILTDVKIFSKIKINNDKNKK